MSVWCRAIPDNMNLKYQYPDFLAIETPRGPHRMTLTNIAVNKWEK